MALFNFRMNLGKLDDPVRLKFIGAYRIDQISRIIEMKVVAHILHNPSRLRYKQPSAFWSLHLGWTEMTTISHSFLVS
jgi:hypothetical protein